uniref:Capsid protein n=1 Tax=Prasiola crispa toti-like virus TaxID=2933125 RepID=A0A9C7LLM0_9VIRU|nr:putative capsid protein [Prasiola crispa toti-like virus]CAI5383882.1 putative capsid protein [Prasiola crispa toti-like virus]
MVHLAFKLSSFPAYKLPAKKTKKQKKLNSSFYTRIMYSKTNQAPLHTYVDGVPIPDIKKGFTIDTRETADVKFTSPCTLEHPPSAREEAVLRKFRVRGAEFDARDELVGVWKGGRVRSRTLGRVWGMSGSRPQVHVANGLEWGTAVQSLKPALAPLASTSVTTEQVSAWGILQTYLNSTGVPIDRGVASSIASMHHAETNSVRLVHRFAAMYVAASTVGNAPFTFGLQNKAPGREVGTLAQLATELASARNGTHYVPAMLDDLDDSAVRRLVVGASCRNLTDRNPTAPGARALRYWPQMPTPVVLMANGDIRGTMDLAQEVNMTASEIYHGAVLWCSHYSSVALFDEAIRWVFMNVITPSNKKHGILPTSNLTYDLPPSNMCAFAAAKILLPIAPIDAAHAPGAPSRDALMETAYLDSIALGLAFWGVNWSLVGWYQTWGLSADQDVREWMRRWSPTKHGLPGWSTAQKVLEKAGISGACGRIVSTLRPTSANWYTGMAHYCELAPQWEEVILRLKGAPANAGIYGEISPLRVKRETAHFGRWFGARDIPEEYGMDHAYASIMAASDVAPTAGDGTIGAGPPPPLEMRLQLWDPDGAMHLRAFSTLTGYSGRPGDFSFCAGIDYRGWEFRPVFRITCRSTYTALTEPDSVVFETRYSIELPAAAPLPITGAYASTDVWPPPTGNVPPRMDPLARPAAPSTDSDSDDEGLDGSSSGSASPRPPIMPPPLPPVDGTAQDDGPGTAAGLAGGNLPPIDPAGSFPSGPPPAAPTPVSAPYRPPRRPDVDRIEIDGATATQQQIDEAGRSAGRAVTSRDLYPPARIVTGSDTYRAVRAADEGWKNPTDAVRACTTVHALARAGITAEAADTLSFFALRQTPVEGRDALTQVDNLASLNIYQALLPVPPADRALAARNLQKAIMHAARLVPFGDTHKRVLRTAMGAASAGATLKSCAALTAQEWLRMEGAATHVNAGYAAMEKGGDGIASKYTVRGRLPEPAAIESWFNKGRNVYWAVKGANEGATVPDEPVGLDLDTVEQMARILISSAVEAGVEVDVEEMQREMGNGISIANLVLTMAAAGEIVLPPKQPEEGTEPKQDFGSSPGPTAGTQSGGPSPQLATTTPRTVADSPPAELSAKPDSITPTYAAVVQDSAASSVAAPTASGPPPSAQTTLPSGRADHAASWKSGDDGNSIMDATFVAPGST